MTRPVGFDHMKRKLSAAKDRQAELLPCPFCGAEPRLRYDGAWGHSPGSHCVACPNCGARTAAVQTEAFDFTERQFVERDSAEMARSLWNRRTPCDPS